MASLSGFTPASTFASLIKTVDNLPLDANPRQLSDGVGNLLPMSASTAGIKLYSTTITGSLNGNASTSTSASIAATASFVTGSNVWGPFGSNSVISASYAATASYATTASAFSGSSLFNYGAFCSTGSQVNPGLNVSASMIMDTTELSRGVTLVSGSRMTVANAGVYNLQFSTVFTRSSGGTLETVSVWFKKNGANVPRSNTDLSIANNTTYLVAAWNYVASLAAGDYLEIAWSATDTGISILASAAQTNPTRPITPGVIATMTQVA